MDFVENLIDLLTDESLLWKSQTDTLLKINQYLVNIQTLNSLSELGPTYVAKYFKDHKLSLSELLLCFNSRKENAKCKRYQATIYWKNMCDHFLQEMRKKV